MDEALRAHYEKVSDLYDEATFEAKVEELERTTGGLIDRDVLALALVDQAGRNEGAVVTLADLGERSEATVPVRVLSLGEARTFQRRGRGEGRVVNLDVTDGELKARLVLWDDDVDLVTEGVLAPGTLVKAVNARVKRTSYGTELHIGRWSQLEVLEGGVADLTVAARKRTHDNLEIEDVEALEALDLGEPEVELEVTPLAEVAPGDRGFHVEARVLAVEPTRTFRRRDGSTGFLAKAHLEDASGRGILTAWDELVQDLQGLDTGARVRFTELRAKEYRGNLELHTSFDTGIEAL